MKNSRRSIYRRCFWIPPILWAGLIYYASGSTLDPEPPFTFPGIDKIAHGSIFFILSCWLYLAFRRERRYRVTTSAVWAAILTSMYGITDEIHQSFVPGRMMEFNDWVADTLGGMMIAAVAFIDIRTHRT